VADKLKRGALGSIADPSDVPSEFASSMARAMEIALNQFLTGEGKDAVPIDNTAESRDRRILFLAISKGIIDHLAANQAAFQIQDVNGNPLNVKIVIRNE
jgi:hypothetical protein